MNFHSSNDFAATAHTYPQLPLGVTATFEMVIPVDWTLVAYDPTLPAVLSTPHMISMMEIAAALAIKPHLPEGYVTVGTRIEVDHLKQSPPVSSPSPPRNSLPKTAAFSPSTSKPAAEQ